MQEKTQEKTPAEIILLSPYELIPHEKVDILHALYILLKMIFFDRFDAPILIDSKTKTILDGHHRSYAAHRLGLTLVPCYQVDYLGDGSITVASRRSNIFIDKKEVLRVALSATVFPVKTTRHKYKIPAFQPVKLTELRK